MNVTIDIVRLGNDLRAFRWRNNLTTAQLKQTMGMNCAGLFRIEYAETKIPTVPTYVKLCALLGKSLEEYLIVEGEVVIGQRARPYRVLTQKQFRFFITTQGKYGWRRVARNGNVLDECVAPYAKPHDCFDDARKCGWLGDEQAARKVEWKQEEPLRESA